MKHSHQIRLLATMRRCGLQIATELTPTQTEQPKTMRSPQQVQETFGTGLQIIRLCTMLKESQVGGMYSCQQHLRSVWTSRLSATVDFIGWLTKQATSKLCRRVSYHLLSDSIIPFFSKNFPPKWIASGTDLWNAAESKPSDLGSITDL